MKRFNLLALLLCSFLTAPITAAIADKSYEDYCVESGGQPESMQLEFHSRSGLVYGEPRLFCNFYLEDAFVSIGLETYASDKPSIAASYIKQLPEIRNNSPLWKGKFTNPGQNVCQNLGGSEVAFVLNGGFANKLGQAGICTFGDGSMVGSWTLIYMANNRTGYETIKNKLRSVPFTL